MKSLRVWAVAALVLLSFTAASGPAGSNNVAGFGASIGVRDPLLRVQFAALDRSRPAEFARLCATSRQAPAISHR
jgi:hypothetical protein